MTDLLRGREIEAHVDVASCYMIEGWVWCPKNPALQPKVSLLSCDGTSLASLTADRPKTGGEGYGYVFYGLLKNVAKIVFEAGGLRTELPLVIEPPRVPDYLADNAAYCDFFAACDFYLIHPDDYLFLFNIGRVDLDRCVHDYISAGVAVSSQLEEICAEYLTVGEKPYALLDFASGFGRIARSLNPDFFRVTASDIHAEAMSFIAGQSSQIQTLLSATRPRDFSSAQSYDVVFAFSFFTHMPDTTFGGWVEALYHVLKPGGLLIFTAHGRIPNAAARIPLADGYGFRPLSEQKDLKSADYGMTISELPYVVKQLKERVGQYPILFLEGSEMGGRSQDLYIVRKEDPGASASEDAGPSVSQATLRMALEKQRAELRAEFENSTSWRLTRPLRAVKEFFIKDKS